MEYMSSLQKNQIKEPSMPHIPIQIMTQGCNGECNNCESDSKQPHVRVRDLTVLDGILNG